MSQEDLENIAKIEEIDDLLEQKVEQIKKLILKKRELLSLIKNEEYKRKVLSKLSHNLRTPLNSILGFAELLLEDSYGRLLLEQKEAVSDIKDAAKELFDSVLGLIDVHQRHLKMYK